MNNPAQAKEKPDTAQSLLQECDALPALLREQAGKKFEEQAKYFMEVESLFVRTAQSVKEFIAAKEKTVAGKTKSNIITLSPAEKKQDTEPGNAKTKAGTPGTGEPRIVPLEKMLDNEITSPYLMLAIEEFSAFIEKIKRSYDDLKEICRDECQSIQSERKTESIRMMITTLDLIEHPDRVKNKNFISDLRKGGRKPFEETARAFPAFLRTAQLAMNARDELYKNYFEQYQILCSALDNCYAVISKAYVQTIKNAMNDFERHENISELYNDQMRMIEIMVQEKNMLEALRYHIHHFMELLLTVSQLNNTISNLEMRGYTLYITRLGELFNLSSG